MKIKTGQIIQLTETLHRMETLTGDAGYAVGRSLLALDPEYTLAQKLRINLFQKYGEKKENGTYVVKARQEDFIKEMDELMNREVDVNIHQLLEEKYDPDAMYCETAQAIDYRVFDELMVERKDPEPSEVTS